MPYRLIKGDYCLFYKGKRHVGSKPDGDSFWFRPKDSGKLVQIGGRKVKFNGGGCAQLRFEGIDALELHFQGSHQKEPECTDARDQLLELAGFKSVTYAPSKDIETTVREANPHPIEGYILSRNVDPYGRPVAFVFLGEAPSPDGSEDNWLSPVWMSESLNSKLMAGGYAYPAYYTGFPTGLRRKMTNLATDARRQRLGVWGVDSSLSGVAVKDPGDLEGYAIWPKLYRRLIAFFIDNHTTISEFDAWIRADAKRDDQLWIVSRGELGNMHDIFTVDDETIRMVVSPEDMVIVPQ